MSTTADTYVLSVAPDTSVELSNMKVQGTKRGIMLGSDGDESQNVSLKLNNVEVEATDRGIATMSEKTDGITVELVNSTVSHGGYTDYTSEYDSRDTRGIAMFNTTNSTVTVENSTVQGYAYPLNVGGTDGTGLVFNVKDSAISGRCAVNSWGSGITYNLDGCELRSINNQGGSTEGFAAIVINNTANDNTVNVSDCSIIGSFNGPGVDNPNATAFLTSVRSTGDKVTITGNTTYSCLPDKGGLDTLMLTNAPEFKIDQSVYDNMFAEWINGKFNAELGSDGMYTLS